MRGQRGEGGGGGEEDGKDWDDGGDGCEGGSGGPLKSAQTDETTLWYSVFETKVRGSNLLCLGSGARPQRDSNLLSNSQINTKQNKRQATT